MFESERAVLEHEASCGERRKQGEYPAGGYAKLGEVLLKLAQNIQENNQIEHDETRDVVREEAEDLRGRIDKILEHQDGELNKQLKLDEAKREVVKAKAEAKKQEREAFEKKVEAGDGTTLEQAKFDAAKAQAKVRKIQEDLKIEKMREKAEKKEALAASRPPATKRTAEASTTEAKRRRRDPNATAAPTTEAREYKVGEIVKLKSKNDGKEFDGIIKSKEEHGYYRVWVQELDKTILRKLPLRAASSK